MGLDVCIMQVLSNKQRKGLAGMCGMVGYTGRGPLSDELCPQLLDHRTSRWGGG